LLCCEESESDELSDPLDEEELESDEELEDEDEAEEAPGIGFGGILGCLGTCPIRYSHHMLTAV